VTRTLRIECGAAETRAALIDDDQAVKFWFAPALGDEAAPQPADDGDLRLGRVRAVSRPLNGAFVDIGEDADAFLPLTDKTPPAVEGEMRIVRIRRPAIGGKGAVLTADWRRDLPVIFQQAIERDARLSDAPSALGTAAPPTVAIARKASLFHPAEIVVDGAKALLSLKSAGLDAMLDETAVGGFDVNAEIEAALARVVPLPGGGRMTIDETEALAAIDVDMGDAATTSAANVNAAVNDSAARVLFRELSRRAIGGRVVVDFLSPPSSSGARAAFEKRLRETDADLYPRRSGRLQRDGLYDLTAPRREKSLLERATEPAGNGFVRAGRRPTLDWRAKAAVAALEGALRRARGRFPTLLVSPDLASYLESRIWATRIGERFGARFKIETHPRLEERSFEVVEG
jgi:Ribonuclease G/E